MKWKEFLVDKRKVIVAIKLIVTIALTVISSMLSFSAQNQVIVSYGFPLSVYSDCRPVLGCPAGRNYGIDYFGIITNVIFWYLVSCLIFWIYHKGRKK